MATNKIVFQASSKHGNVVRDTPRQAAWNFFLKYSKARTCTVRQVEDDGQYIVYSCNPNAKLYRDVTKKTVCTLPDESQA